MQVEKKFFGTGSGNFDDADFAIGENQWVNMENCRVGSTDFLTGGIGYVESIGSTTLLASGLPSSQNYTIGGAYEQNRNRLIFFIWNSLGFHQIRVWDISTSTLYIALYTSQVDEGLDFDKSYLLDVRMINGVAYWTDNLNEPKKLNIDSAIKMNYPSYVTDATAYSSPLKYTELTVIRRPPFYALSISKEEDVDYENNFIKNDAFQFAVRYRYREYEYSVIGEWSVLAPFNNIDETFNFIAITMPLSEVIDQDVIEVELVVKYLISNNGFVIHTWKQSDIEAHNSGTQLSFNFYNDIIGAPLNDATINKPFDRVPLVARTNESGRNRLFYANFLTGYDTPTSTSLTITVANVDGSGNYPAIWGLYTVIFTLNGSQVESYALYVAFIPTLGIYYVWATDPQPTPPLAATMSALDADFNTTISLDIAAFLINNGYTGGFDYDSYSDSFETEAPVSGLPATLTVTDVDLPFEEGQRSFKSEGAYGAGIVFFDRYRRKCGVVTNDGLILEMPPRTYDTAVFNLGISWQLSNANALTEIPDWAWYYAPTRTVNLRAKSFMQLRASATAYVIRNDDGTYDYSNTTWDIDRYGIAIDISALVGVGMGYVFTEGDIVRLFFDDASEAELSILAQDGKWIIAQSEDVGTLGPTELPLFEIYTPYRRPALEGYFEVGQVYAITDPGTSSREYSVVAGLFNGDVYILTRGDTGDEYLTENMSPNDKLWNRWFTDIGWINIVDNIGQVRLRNSIVYSNTYVEGTRINGLSVFDALDQSDIPIECGPIQKLQITSKVNNEQGAVMLSICSKETASLYLGETQLVASAANAFIAQSVGVIGTINILKGSYGTNNPESVKEYRGNVTWYDAYNGKYIQYSLNGLFPISNYKATRFWKLFSDQYLSMSESEIEALGSRPFVFSGVDPHNNELLVSVPKLSSTPPRGYLIDYPSIIYPFDIVDFQAKSLVYRLDKEPNFWQGSYMIPAEFFIEAQDELYSFKDGGLYIHNSSTSFCSFYGVQYKPRIMVVSNMETASPKTYLNTYVESNMAPTFTYFYNDYPYVQTSDLADFDYNIREGIFYAPIYRNKIVPTATGMNTNGLLTAEKMRATALKALYEFTSTTTPLQLKFVNLGFNLSAGHTT